MDECEQWHRSRVEGCVDTAAERVAESFQEQAGVAAGLLGSIGMQLHDGHYNGRGIGGYDHTSFFGPLDHLSIVGSIAHDQPESIEALRVFDRELCPALSRRGYSFRLPIEELGDWYDSYRERIGKTPTMNTIKRAIISEEYELPEPEEVVTLQDPARATLHYHESRSFAVRTAMAKISTDPSNK